MQSAPLNRVTYLAYGVLGVAFFYTLVSFYIVPLPLSSLFLVLIRWTHFVGAFTAVGAIFTAVFIISPVLRALFGETQVVASSRLLPVLLGFQTFALDIAMAGGLALAWFLSGGKLFAFVSTRWGLSVLAAGILTIVMSANTDRGLRRNGFNFNAHRLSGIVAQMSSPNETNPSNQSSILQSGLTRVIRVNFGLALAIMFLMGFAAHGGF